MGTVFLKQAARFISYAFVLSMAFVLVSCTSNTRATDDETILFDTDDPILDTQSDESSAAQTEEGGEKAEKGKEAAEEENASENTSDVNMTIEDARAALNLSEDYRTSFAHGEKPAQFQKYIMLHDTEGDSSPQAVIDWWDGNGNLVAAHFIVGIDGAVMQCVPMDAIAHHAGFGDAGHNASFGVEDESRDDRLGTVPIGDWAPDYGMNSYSIGIELVHVGGSGDYPETQLNALDALIAYIDAYYGFPSRITDHKSWRSGNSDTSSEFADYLANYQLTRNHRGA